MNMLKLSAIFLFLISLNVVAQNDMSRSIDSLENLLETNLSDTARGRLMSFLAQAYSGYDSAKTFDYAIQSLRIQQKEKNHHGIALAYHTLAGALADYGNLPAAKENYQQAYQIIEHDSSAMGNRIRIRVIGNLAFTEGKMGFPQKELALLVDLIPEIEKTNDSSAAAVVYHNIAAKLIDLDEYNKAYPYLIKSTKILKHTKLTESLGFNYLSLANCMHGLDSLTMMKKYLDLAYDCFVKTEDSNEWSQYYTYYGQYLSSTEQYKQAIAAYNKAEELAERKQQWYRMENILEGRFETHLQMKNYDQARKALHGYYENAIENNNKENQLDALKNFAKLDEASGNLASAYLYLKKYNQLHDSVDQKAISIRVRELETQYQASEKEKKILTLENTNQEQELDLQKNKLVNYALTSGIIILLLGLTLAYILFMNARRVTNQREELHNQKVKEMEHEKQMATYAAVLRGQEQERQRLARDLHDGLGGTLAGIRLNLSHLVEKNQHPADHGMNQVIGQLDYSVHELRRIARNMMPETLLQFGLEAALKDLCEGFQLDYTKIIFQPYNLRKTISQSDQIMIYRIIQELLTNAIKYAEASQILVQCVQENNVFQITVEDDGKGFDTCLTADLGMGLTNVRNRVEYLNGQMDLQSSTSVGTTVNIEVFVHEV